MSDSKLRSDLIRLASRSTPEVRKALLPLLKKTAGRGPNDKIMDLYREADDHLSRARSSLKNFVRQSKEAKDADEFNFPGMSEAIAKLLRACEQYDKDMSSL